MAKPLHAQSRLSAQLLADLACLDHNHYTIRLTPYGHYDAKHIAYIFNHKSILSYLMAEEISPKIHIHVRITTNLKKSSVYEFLAKQLPKLKGNGMKSLHPVIYNGKLLDNTSWKSATYVMKDADKAGYYWHKTYTKEQCFELMKLGKDLKPRKKGGTKKPIYLRILEETPALQLEANYTDIKLTMKTVSNYYIQNFNRYPNGHQLKRVLHNMYMTLDKDYREKFYKELRRQFYYELCVPKFSKGLKATSPYTYDGDTTSDDDL